MEWRKGCSCCNDKPIQCNECTLALIKAVDAKAFLNEAQLASEKLITEHGAFGIPMAAAHFAVALQTREITIRAINEHNNTQD